MSEPTLHAEHRHAKRQIAQHPGYKEELPVGFHPE